MEVMKRLKKALTWIIAHGTSSSQPPHPWDKLGDLENHNSTRSL
jgi:hypothetical protein